MHLNAHKKMTAKLNWKGHFISSKRALHKPLFLALKLYHAQIDVTPEHSESKLELRRYADYNEAAMRS
jgi:hypothetical protein